jgi:prepilin-type processing-associated H-X9-DG protein
MNSAGKTVSWGQGGIFHCPSFPDDESGEYGINSAISTDGAASWQPAGFVPKTTSLAVLNTPADTVIVAEKGHNNVGWGYIYFESNEGNWTDTTLDPSTGQPGYDSGKHYDLDQTETNPTGHPHDCDYPFDGETGGAWDGCGLYPRYRHTNTCNMIFSDGHAKAMNRGRVKWYQNIYPGPTGFNGGSGPIF